jgi:hypothetical protein
VAWKKTEIWLGGDDAEDIRNGTGFTIVDSEGQTLTISSHLPGMVEQVTVHIHERLFYQIREHMDRIEAAEDE